MARSLTSTRRLASGHQMRRYSVRPFYLTILVFTALAATTWFVRRLADRGLHVPIPLHVGQQSRGNTYLSKRDEVPECRLVRSVNDQCAFVQTNCPDHDGLFSYLQFYYCNLAHVKPLAFIILVLWLSLLFSTIGIAASDFLCIDLSTIAGILGLSESLTGVTFLAFGNGSPDVFSTFAAMRSNSATLAIGELLGAAGFITSVVAGSMALVRPFKVARRSFVRDVGYFIIAVAFSMGMVADGHLHMWESAAMVGLYAFYVMMVVTWHWYLVRKRRSYERNVAARTHFHIPENQELEIEEAAEDDDPGVAVDSRSSLLHASTEDFDNLERAQIPAWKEGEEDDETRNRYLAEIRENMHVYRPTRRRNTLNPIRPSLVGALEFQSVLSSLQRARNVHQDLEINMDRYTDDTGTSTSPHARRPSGHAFASYPPPTRPGDRLSPHSEASSSRGRAVSASDAGRVRLDTTTLDPQTSPPVQVTVSRPSGEVPDNEPSAPPTVPRIDTNIALTVSPPPLTPAGPSRSPSPSPGGLTPADLLAPPDNFLSPNYQGEAIHTLSPRPISPRAIPPGSSDFALESPLSPFPPFLEALSTSSSREPSIRVSSPTDLLRVHDSIFGGVPDGGSRTPSPINWWPYWLLPAPQSLMSTLFPTLTGWKAKNIWARLLAIIAAPSVLLLTITLPVVEPLPPNASGPEPVPIVVTSVEDDENAPAPPIMLPEDSPRMYPVGHEAVSNSNGHDNSNNNNNKRHSQSMRGRRRWDSELPPVQSATPALAPCKEWCRWLVILQLFTGPFFIVLIGWTSIDSDLHFRDLLLPSLLSLLFSLICVTGLTVSTRHGNHTHLPGLWRPFFALLGFFVAIAWIATIASEVVSLLKTLGVILDISDSLLGLTIFAVGNSLGDLVADITVARLGYPVMALSACFGGPMLNILLGIGLGGLYMTLHPHPSSHHRSEDGLITIAISKVLIISAATLLFTLVALLIVVPLNKWRMDRKIGWGLVILWVVSAVGNVIVEVTTD